MFFCNTDGVLMYDGKTWSLIQTPAQSVVRSLGMDDKGKIFVGALDDLGYLDKQKNGQYIFVSLLDKLKAEHHGMGNIWQTFAHGGSIYFESETGLFGWNGERFNFWPWPNPQSYHLSFYWNGRIYLQEEGLGLMTLKGDKFSMAPDGDFFKTIRIYNILPIKNNIVQLATQYEGLFHYDGKKVKRFPTQADKFFKTNQIYCGLTLADSSFVYGTRLGGAIIIDENGLIRYMIDHRNGLPTNIALGLTLDREGNLWFSLDNGISKVEINNGISSYDNRNGLEGSINGLCRYNGKLYVTTNSGLYVLKPNSFPTQGAHFEKVAAINRSSWNLLKVNKGMLVSSTDGLFEMRGDDLHQLSPDPSYAIHRCKSDSNRIVVAMNNQLKSFKLTEGQWLEAGQIDNIDIDNVSFSENHNGKIWLTTYSQGAALLSFSAQDGLINYENGSIKFLGVENGLPLGSVTANFIAGEEIFQVGSKPQFFRFNHSSARFEEDSAFIRRFGLPDKNIFPLTDEDSSGSFFFRTMPEDNVRQQLILMKRRDHKSFEAQRFDISRIAEHVHINFYPEKDVWWFGGADGVVRYEIPDLQLHNQPFKTYINKIILLGDSVFYQGIGNADQNLTFPYSSNSFRFEFTATNFVAEERNQFQYMLEGYDDSWSDWTTENIKEYPRLWEGSYIFLVRSRNYAEQPGTTDHFAFVVSPPWFRSFYAYAFYFIASAVFVWILIRVRLRNVVREKEALEAEIALQTQEIRQQNIQLAEQSEELKVNAEQLKELDQMKSNFFVNISHEFRTPLSLILGPLEKFMQEKGSAQIRLTEMERMHRNAKRLQELINQLLDLAKLESGGMKLNVTQSDFLYFIRVLCSSFESLAEGRNIRFDANIPTGSYETLLDYDKLETILYNLLSNAFKFTPDGGGITLNVSLPNDNTSQLVAISIADTGPGIPEEDKVKIFDRFYQVDSSSSREFEGSGIGLSLVKELVELMDGTIEVQSSASAGATFTIKLPLKQISASALPITDKSESVFDVSAEGYSSSPVLPENSALPTESLILLVEDNADLRSYLYESLEGDYQVAVAENGLQGFEKALELIPDLIVSDMMMPVMDGFSLCAKIRSDERTSHIPFVLLTARSTIESKLAGLELGADEYITKPFNIKEVQVRVRNLLEQRKNLRKSFSREVTVQPKNISITSVDERFLNHALEIMEAHLSDEQFSVERFADEMGMSRKNLLRKIKALTDQSVNEFIRNFRLQRAAQLIMANAATISEIAYKVGFNNLSYFSKCFKELFGAAPNEYRS